MPENLPTLNRKYSLIASAVLAAGFLAGCANTSAPGSAGTSATVKSEEMVNRRAQQRVDLLLQSKYDQAYEYLLPSYRALNNAESYRNRFGSGAKWVDPKVDKVECTTEERCVVTFKLGILVVARGFGTKPIDSTMFETWLKEDGQWWYYQRD